MALWGEFFYDPSKWRPSIPFVEQLRAFQELIDEGKVNKHCSTIHLHLPIPALKVFASYVNASIRVNLMRETTLIYTHETNKAQP